MIEALRPASREEWLTGRMSAVGASELPALFGANPYLTAYELWAVKSGLYVKDFAEAEIETDAIHIPPTARGNLLEAPAFELIQRLRPDWELTPNQIPGGKVFVDRVIGMSATPDVFVREPGRDGRAVVQVKTMTDSVFARDWQIDGAVQVPVAVAIQAIADATLSESERAYAAAMVVSWRTSLYLIEVDLHAALMVRARLLVLDFWRRVRGIDPYPPDFARDGAVIADLYRDDNGAEVDLSGNPRVTEIVAQRGILKAREADGSAAEKERKKFDDELRFILGNAARGQLADGRILEAKTVRRSGYSVEPTTYRPVKIIDPGSAPARRKKSAAAETQGGYQPEF